MTDQMTSSDCYGQPAEPYRSSARSDTHLHVALLCFGADKLGARDGKSKVDLETGGWT
jgi:hypothetical protein